jgi:hypothetical protein
MYHECTETGMIISKLALCIAAAAAAGALATVKPNLAPGQAAADQATELPHRGPTGDVNRLAEAFPR